MRTHIHGSDVPVEPLPNGKRRQILGYDTNLMLVKVFFEKGGIGERHRHPHQQVSYVVQGVFEVEIDGRKEVMRAGDCFVVPSNAMHGAVCLEEGILIDTFSPMRDDFLAPQQTEG